MFILGDNSFNNASEGDTFTQEDTVFVQGLDKSATVEQISAHFGQIGMIKVIICTLYIIITL